MPNCGLDLAELRPATSLKMALQSASVSTNTLGKPWRHSACDFGDCNDCTKMAA